MNITEHESGPMRLFASRTGAKDMVVIEGSVLGGYRMLTAEQRMAPHLAAELFDAGTKTMSKDAIRSALASRGASVSFSAGSDRTQFSATCLPEDTEFVLKLIAECLRNASFPTAELSLQKKRTVAELEESKTSTRGLANAEFFRTVYDAKHANYTPTILEKISLTEQVTRADLIAYQKLLGKGGLVVAITGDVQPSDILKKAERAFSVLSKGTQQMSEKSISKAVPRMQEKRIVVRDKANIDVMIGAHTPFTYDSPEYLPFVVLMGLLGGRGLSTSHLMRTIRERDGLTYGIYSSPVGFSGGADGAFQIWATFSPNTFDKAVAATKKEIQVFLDSGITPAALESKKVETIGRYSISLATSGGLASFLHAIGVEGKPLSYVDEYPSLVNAITVKDVKTAASLIPFDSLTITAAGTFEAKAKK